MYNERNTEFSIRDIVLQLLFVVLFVFILLWLFPSKGDINKLANKMNNNKNNVSVDSLLVRVFNDNLLNMKDAAKEYFTTERLPQKVGDKVTLTLGQMLDKKLLLPFVDSKGRQCDLTKSYVEVTKTSETEYTMKVNLSCTDAEDYVLVPMGCYNFCATAICEKEQVKQVTNPGTKQPTPINNTPKEEPKKEDPKPENPKVEYLYEYQKTIDGYYTAWGKWSKWSEEYVRKTPVVDVEIALATTTVTLKTGTSKVVETKIPYTTTEKVLVTTKVTKDCANWKTVTVSTGQVKYVSTSDWKYVKTIKSATPPKDTNTTMYIRVPDSSMDTLNCSTNCDTTYASYEVYQRVTKTVKVKQTKQVCTDYKLTYEPQYIEKTVTKYETITKTVPIYEEVPVTIRYYRYRTRKYVPAQTITKWSKYQDTSLLKDGYTYTGRRKVATS